MDCHKHSSPLPAAASKPKPQKKQLPEDSLRDGSDQSRHKSSNSLPPKPRTNEQSVSSTNNTGRRDLDGSISLAAKKKASLELALPSKTIQKAINALVASHSKRKSKTAAVQ